jgi:hypothetical protein
VTAFLSDDGRYRYWLRRECTPTLFGSDYATCAFVMLNPSTADAEIDDQTIRRCRGVAAQLDCARLEVVNLYAYRATTPAQLWLAEDPVGDNADYMAQACRVRGPLIVAWGTNAKPDQVADFVDRARGRDLYCLGINKDGSPRHPLYVPARIPLREWEPDI